MGSQSLNTHLDKAARSSEDKAYIDRMADFIYREYHLKAISIVPANRGYYGETWRMDTADASYFLKLDYFSRHQEKFQNSLPVVAYLCDNGIDFISKVIRTTLGSPYTHFESATLAIFEWVDAENMETDDTKIPEYQMLGKIYPLTKPGFMIPRAVFSDAAATRFYDMWESLKEEPRSEANDVMLSLFELHWEALAYRASRLLQFASLCKSDTSSFYFTHGDAGGNFMAGVEKYYIIDWDEVMYAPLERDAWVMCPYDWARKAFQDALRQNGISYELRSERLAFYCYHMFFWYLGEILEDFMVHGERKGLEEYLDGFIEDRIRYADSIL
jgi:hypothetical protein